MANENVMKEFESIFGETGNKVLDKIRPLSPRLVEHVYDYIAGELYADSTLDKKTRELCVVSSLASQGGLQEQLRVHIEAALRNGATKEEISSVCETVGSYAGVPRALNAMFVAIEVFDAWDKENNQ